MNTMQTTHLDDLAMAYDDFTPARSDDVVPVLLLHGAVQTRAIWSAQIHALASTRRVIAPDLRGHGRTSLGSASMSIGQMAQDCVALLDALRVPRVVVCGVSLGGMVALEMAARSPDRVSAIVLSNTPRALSARRWVRRLVDWIDPHRLLRPAFATIGQERSARIGLAAARLVVGPHWVGREARRHFVSGFAAMSEDAIVATYRAIVESRPTDIAAIGCPCLIVEGVNDAPAINDQADSIGHAMPDGQMAKLNAGHVANLDDPAAFNRLLMAFLERHDQELRGTASAPSSP